MKNIFIVSSAALFLAVATAASAGEGSRKNERRGVGGGALVGAIAGGPVGLIVGASVGGFVGSKVTGVKNVERVEDELSAANVVIADLETRLAASSHEIARLSREASAEEVEDALAGGLHLKVMYSTGEAELTGDARRLLTDLAVLLKTMPSLDVQLDGYADQRGASEYNDTLSVNRVAGVRDILIEAGVANSRIESNSHGARQSQAPDGDLDAYALERRVSITLVPRDQDGAVARND